jgi:glycosyltransferase involved in cell wall biosynthesis
MSLNSSLFPVIPPPPESARPRPFWSVIVPAYRARYLGQCLRSVLDQDPGPEQMQILVMDDCSPEALEPIVRELGVGRIEYVRQAQNLGTYKTENAGLCLSRGIWTHILNDDDWVLPGFYETLQRALQEQPDSVGAACCGYVNTDAQGETTWTSPPFRPEAGVLSDWLRQMGSRNPTHPVAVVVRRSVHERVGGYYPPLNYCADWELYKRAATFYDWWYEPDTLACYREHGANTTSAGLADGSQIRDIGRAIELSKQYLPADCRDEISLAAQEIYIEYAFGLAVDYLQARHLTAALSVLNAGLELSRSPRTLHFLLSLLALPEAEPLLSALPELFLRLEQSRRASR